MFTKRVRVRRGNKTYVYVKLVESYRDGGRVRQRVVANLGREDALKASGQLDSLAAAFTRLDPPLTGTRREVGPLLLVAHYLNRLGLMELVDQHIPQHGRARLTHGEVVSALIANRLSAPSPLYDVAGWATSAAMAEVFKVPGALLNDDRLGRALDAFKPVAEAVRGSVALRAIEEFGADAARLHLDLTTLRVAGAYEDSSLVLKGWGSDRRVARQVRVLAATNADGVSLYTRPHSGDAAELTCLGAALEGLGKLLPPGLLVCADSALGHLKNLCAAHRAGLRFIVPLRASTKFLDRFHAEVEPHALHRLNYVSRREKHLKPAKRTKYKGLLRPFPVTDPETKEERAFRVAYVWSSEEAKSVAEARERALAKVDKELARIRNGLGGRYYKTVKQVDAKVSKVVGRAARALLRIDTGTHKGKPFLRWKRNAKAITDAAKSDGVYALLTNLSGRRSATEILRTYKDQQTVERAHRDAKQTLRVRPIFLHNDDRIEALVSVVGLALLVFGLIEVDVRRALGSEETLDGLLPEGRAARPNGRNVLAAFQGLGLTYTQNGLLLDRLTTTQRRLLELLKVPIPWPEQPR